MPKSRIRSINESPEMLKISGNAVGQVSLEVRPDPLIGIKLRRISGEVNGMDSRISFQESLGKFGFVERAAVPEKEERTSDLAAEVPEKPSDLLAPNVSVGIKAGVEAEAFSLGRDRDGGDGRDLCPLSGDNEGWSFSSNRPGPANVGDKRESAFVEKDDAGFKPFGFFLYGAKCNASSDEWLSPCVPGPASRASGSSIPDPSSGSINCLSSSVPRSVSESLDRYVSRSKDPSSNRLLKALLPGFARGSSSASRKDARAGRGAAWVSNRPVPFSRRLDANGLRSSPKRLLPCRPPRKSGLDLTAERPDVSVSPVVEGFHRVSSSPPRLPSVYRPELASITFRNLSKYRRRR